MEQKIFDALRKIYGLAVPCRDDSPKRVLAKILADVSAVALVTVLALLSVGFFRNERQKKNVEISRQIWHDTSVADEKSKWEKLTEENPDFRGWVFVPGTEIDYPIYQATDDSFYLSHNQRREKYKNGAVFFRCQDNPDLRDMDRNLTVFGHETTDNSMFTTLLRYRRLAFYKNNPTFCLSTRYHTGTYKIFAVMILNGNPADDNGRIFDITREDFTGADDFKNWVDEARQRSLIQTDVAVDYGDSMVSLVTCCEDIRDARFVVMARLTRADETTEGNTAQAKNNPSPRYPKKWYDNRKKEFPY